MMLKFSYRFLISCFILFFATFSNADIKIIITDGINTAKPIAVVPFKWIGNGAPPQDIDSIIASDLRNSGKFNPIDSRKMPQLPDTASAVTPKAWSALGIDAVVVGNMNVGYVMLLTPLVIKFLKH